MNNLLTLSDELLCNILQYCDIHMLGSLGSAYKEICRKDECWKILLKKFIEDYFDNAFDYALPYISEERMPQKLSLLPLEPTNLAIWINSWVIALWDFCDQKDEYYDILDYLCKNDLIQN